MQYFNGCLSLISGLLYQQYHLCMSYFFKFIALFLLLEALIIGCLLSVLAYRRFIGYVSAVVPSLTCVVLFVRV